MKRRERALTKAEMDYDDYVDPRRAYRNPWTPEDDEAQRCRLLAEVEAKNEERTRVARPKDCRP